jgi:hypothetical protein
VAVMVIRGYAVPIICCSFALSGPVRYAYKKIALRRHQEQSLF